MQRPQHPKKLRLPKAPALWAQKTLFWLLAPGVFLLTLPGVNTILFGITYLYLVPRSSHFQTFLLVLITISSLVVGILFQIFVGVSTMWCSKRTTEWGIIGLYWRLFGLPPCDKRCCNFKSYELDQATVAGVELL